MPPEPTRTASVNRYTTSSYPHINWKQMLPIIHSESLKSSSSSPNSLVPLRRVYRQPSARCAHIRLRQLSLLLINNRPSTSPTASFVDRNLVAMNHSENHHLPPYHHVVLRSDPVPFTKGLSYKFKFFLILVPFVFCFWANSLLPTVPQITSYLVTS